MKPKYFYIAFFALIFPHLSFAASLDEIYRDIVKSENEGYLPLFVKNRQPPDFLDEEALEPPAEKTEATEKTEPVSLTNERKLRDDKERTAEQKWKDTIEAVRQSRITPVELEEVEKRAGQNHPKAVEIYAWMLARGAGIGQNLPRAFSLYQKAALLNVPDAEKNAVIVYKAMTPDERAKLEPYSLPEESEEK
jgi:hypothetical protein